MAACCCYSWLVRIRVVELKESVAGALQPTSYLLLRLPKGVTSDVDCVEARVNRFGFWPWEERLLLTGVEPILTQNRVRQRDPVLYLLSAAAKTSDRALDRLVELCNQPDPKVVDDVIWRSLFHIQRLRDEQLAALLESALQSIRVFSPPDERSQANLEPILVEMIRRNRPAFREQIARSLGEPPVDSNSKVPMNLELLAALRRMQGRPDPLRILVKGPLIVPYTTGDLPIQASITNVDADRQAVGFKFGDDYWGDRQQRWSFKVCDEQGELHVRPSRRGAAGGGTTQFGVLDFGQSYQTTLYLNRYVRPLYPGRYQVVVLYHNSSPIAGHGIRQV